MGDILEFKEPAKVLCPCGVRKQVRKDEHLHFCNYECSLDWHREHQPSAVQLVQRGNLV